MSFDLACSCGSLGQLLSDRAHFQTSSGLHHHAKAESMLESKYPSCYVKIPGTANGSSELQRLPGKHWKAFLEGLPQVMEAAGGHVLNLLD